MSTWIIDTCWPVEVFRLGMCTILFLSNRRCCYVFGCLYSILDINECASNPCKNGAACNNGNNRFTCTCAGGWTGTTCTTGKHVFFLQWPCSFYVCSVLFHSFGYFSLSWCYSTLLVSIIYFTRIYYSFPQPYILKRHATFLDYSFK